MAFDNRYYILLGMERLDDQEDIIEVAKNELLKLHRLVGGEKYKSPNGNYPANCEVVQLYLADVFQELKVPFSIYQFEDGSKEPLIHNTDVYWMRHWVVVPDIDNKVYCAIKSEPTPLEAYSRETFGREVEFVETFRFDPSLDLDVELLERVDKEALLKNL